MEHCRGSKNAAGPVRTFPEFRNTNVQVGLYGILESIQAVFARDKNSGVDVA